MLEVLSNRQYLKPYNIKNLEVVNMYKKASSTLLRLSKNVLLKLHLNLSGKAKDGVTEVADDFYSVYSNNSGGYITFDVKSFLSLEMKDDRPWHPSRSITIHTRNIFPFVNGINLMLSYMYEKDSFFYTDRGELTVNKDKLSDYTVNVIGLGPNQYMTMRPAIYYEISEDELYEGVLIEINNTSNAFVIPIGVLEAFKYTMDKFDFTLYTNTLLNTYLNTLYDKEAKNKVEEVKPKVNVFMKGKSDEDSRDIEQRSIKGSGIDKGELSKEGLLNI